MVEWDWKDWKDWKGLEGLEGKGQNLHILDMVPTLPKIFTYFQLNTNNFHYPKGVENTNPYDSTVD